MKATTHSEQLQQSYDTVYEPEKTGIQKLHFDHNKLRLAILQRVCAGYRVSLFAGLSTTTEIEMSLFIGEDLPGSKVKSGSDLTGVNFRKLKTRFIRLGRRVFPWHVDLIGELRKFKPDVILCEGESHFIGYLQAIIYRYLFDRHVALMHWCFISLPGWSCVGGCGYRALIKRFFRRFFDAFVVYSSFSKDCLLRLGQPSEKIFVATNVGDTQRFIQLADSLTESASEARSRLELPERFTVLYLGTLEDNKRPDVMLDLARECDVNSYNFVLLGSGPLLERLRERVVREGLTNVFLLGRVVRKLPLYCRAADVLLVPGRGGIVISEAMAFGLPVVVHETDGTEYDLVQNEVTGFHVSDGSVESFRKALEFLRSKPSECIRMGSMGRRFVESHFTTNNMVEQIIRAARFAKDARAASMHLGSENVVKK